jgi:Tfp pilus assembly protein PilX
MRLKQAVENEQGFALIFVVLVTALLSLLALTLLDTVQFEQDRTIRSGSREASFQAAEAGIHDYVAKLVDDRLYYSHNVHIGESTREATDGTTTTAGSPWTKGLTWTYPNGRDAWRDLPNGYEYNLQVTAPTATSPTVKIVSTGRAEGNTTDLRVIETLIRPSSVADFQMLANATISYGDTATTFGKIYAGRDEFNVNHSVNHDGTAHADIYAEGSVSGSTTLEDGAQRYGSATIRSVIKSPINFNNFLSSLVDIERGSLGGGLNLDDLAADNGIAVVNAWRLTFLATGSLLAQPCLLDTGRHPAELPPICDPGFVEPVPANGAIYSTPTVVVSGMVNGRVTVATNNDMVVGDDLSYVAEGDDVLGLIARNEVLVALWVPINLTWRAATIAQGGKWRSWTGTTLKGTMTFKGSTATKDGGYMSMFANRVYEYDETLVYLPPPWFPTVEEAYTIVLFRELPPT